MNAPTSTSAAPPASSLTLRSTPDATSGHTTASAPGRSAHGPLSRTWRGRPEDPAWARPALLGLLAGTALLYLWGLGASGWANSFYSAAAQAGSASWKAFFFGSSDAANSITVDKTPFALWPMGLSVRIFGLSSWSILVPQALEGVATVGLLYAVVRRTTASPVAGLLAGLTMAMTPIAVLMFRFNNPDAMLVLLMVAAAGATLRAVDSERALRWMVLAGTLVGLAFLTKMLQAFLVLPALGLAYLLFARTSVPRRIGHLLVAFGAMVAAAGWWIAIVELWPAASRPYIGGSQTNSILELTLGYNGFGRLSGNETGSVGGGGGTTGGTWGATGITRLFNTEIGGQIAWLVPAALVLGGVAFWLARSVRVRAALLLWGTWLVVTGLTFSFMAGIFHAYYTVALAPAVAALVGIGAWTLWRHRRASLAAAALSFTTSLTAVFAFFLLDRTSSYHPWLRWVVLLAGVGSALLLAGVRHLSHRIALVVAGVALTSALAGPAAYALTTAATPHTGSIVDAGPSTGSGLGGLGGPGARPGGTTGAPPVMPGQMRGGTTTGGATGQFPGSTAGGARTGGSSTGGLLNGSTSSTAITKLLEQDAASYTWAAAAIGSNTAAGYQLASQQPVMPIGGFNGSDPSPTLRQFEALVEAGRIHWFIAGGGMGGGGINAGGNTSSSISAWVQAHYTARTVSGVTLYDLTSPRTGTSGTAS